MKSILLISGALLLSGLADGQKLKEPEVPIAVRQSFTKNFPRANQVKWSKESATEFEAEFMTGKIEQSASFDPSGKWLETETEIKNSALPALVQASITKEFPGFKIEESEKREVAGKPLHYEVELEKNKVTYEVQFSAEGKVIKKEEKKEKEKD